MPPCDFEIKGPRNLRKDEAATYALDPSPQHPCRTQIKINGQDAELHKDFGGFVVTAIGLGTVSVKVDKDKDNPTFEIKITLDCRDAMPPCGPTTETINVGTTTEPRLTFGEVLIEGLKTIALPLTAPLTGVCWLLWWIDVVLNGRKNAKRSLICFVCDLLPDWLCGGNCCP